MSLLFVSASTQKLETALAVADLGSTPLTMSAWVYPTQNTLRQTILYVGDRDGTGRCELQLQGDLAGDSIGAAQTGTGGGGSDAQSTTGYSLNTWHHACAVFAATNSRAAYLDGGSKGTNTTTRALSTAFDTTLIGARIVSGVYAQYLSARACDLAIWNVALTDAEIAALARGISPLRVRPTNLQGYWPLHGLLWGSNEPSWHPRSTTTNNYDMSPSNSPTLAAHAPVEPYSRRFWGVMGLVPVVTIDVTPGALAATGVIVAPVVTTGQDIAAGPVAAQATIVAPTVATGVEVSLSPLSAAATLVAPLFEIATEVTLSPLTAAATLVAPSITVGNEITLSPLQASATPVAPSVAVAVTVEAPALAAAATIVAPVVSIAQEVNLSPLVITFNIQPPTAAVFMNPLPICGTFATEPALGGAFRTEPGIDGRIAVEPPCGANQ